VAIPSRGGGRTIGRGTAGRAVGDDRAVIRNVVIHVENEQPLLADLFAMPNASDVGLVCTNVRLMDGKRPVFIDRIESTFFFPYHIIRFLELPQGVAPSSEGQGRRRGSSVRSRGTSAETTPDQGEDEVPGTLLPVAVGADQVIRNGADGDLDIELELDEEFLQRIRDI
jgi:hypothetical protein